MILLLIVILLFILFAGLLLMPASIVADTERKMYFISIPLYFKASVSEEHEEWKIRFSIFHIPFTLNFAEKKKSSSQKADLKKKRKKKRRKPDLRKLLTSGKQLLKSFRIKKLKATIDTGDFPLNAQLIPVVSQINNENISIGINFENYNSLYMRIVTRLYKLVWIAIRYIIF